MLKQVKNLGSQPNQTILPTYDKAGPYDNSTQASRCLITAHAARRNQDRQATVSEDLLSSNNELSNRMQREHSQEQIKTPKLSNQFWEFVNNLQIPVASSFSYRNNMGSYYERVAGTIDKPNYASKDGSSLEALAHPLSEKRTAN